MAASSANSAVRRIVSDPFDGSSTARLLTQGIAHAVLAATAIWQGLMLAAIALTPGPWTNHALLAAGHAFALMISALAWRGKVPASIPIAITYVLFLFDWISTDDADSLLLFTACWMVNLVNAASTFTMRGRWALALPLGASTILPPAMMLTRPDLDSPLISGVFVTGWSIVAATRFGYSFLTDFATRADHVTQEALRDQARAVAARTASLEASEQARVLHDTVVNTLAVIATGGALLHDREAVRARCATDAETATGLQAGNDDLPLDRLSLRAVASQPGFPIRHRGIDGDDLIGLEAGLRPDVARVLRRAVLELVLNAAKHSGASLAELTVVQDGNLLTVRVSDDGVGFSGSYPADRGLARSVVQRAAEVDIRVAIETAPGEGTTVSLTVPLANPTPSEPEEETLGTDLRTLVDKLRKRATFLWAVGVATVGLVLAVVNHRGQWNSEYLMVAVAGLGTWYAWHRVERRGALGSRGAAVVTVAAALAFFFSATAVDLGRTEPVVWQAIGATGLLAIMVEHASRRWLRGALLVYTGNVAGIAVAAGTDSVTAAGIVVVAGIAGLGLTGGWLVMKRALGATAARAAADQRAAARARLTTAQRKALEDARARWQAASLRQAVTLLRGVAGGTVDPASPATQQAAAEEEGYLRQLILLSPDLIHMAPWLARALEAAHLRHVNLRIRTGDDDVEPALAAAWGLIILDAVEHTTEGEDLTVTMFATTDRIRLTVVGGEGSLSKRAPIWEIPATVHSWGSVDVAEVDAPRLLAMEQPL